MFRRYIALIAGIVAALVLAMLAQAAPQPAPEIIYTRTPRPRPTSTQKPELPVFGATIELYIEPTATSLWTVVQWQDRWGVWHDVEGWQGTTDDDKQVWWVARPDYRKGPFRWLVFQSPKGELLAISPSFNLPSSDGDSVQMKVSIAP